jgi:alanyl-tRNA synthetase
VLAYLRETEGKLKAVAEQVRGTVADVTDKVQQALARSKELEKELAALKSKLAAAAGGDLAGQARDIKGVKVLSAQVEGVDGNGLRALMDQLKNKLGSGIIILGAAAEGKASLIAGVTADLTGKVKAGELVNFVAGQVGGKGGGRPDMAQAGGTQPENLPQALASVSGWIEGKL